MASKLYEAFTSERPAPNNSFKPNLLRYGKTVAGKACHCFASTTQVGLIQALGADMVKRVCPACKQPAVSVWRLLSLSGLRRAICPNCGTKIGLSPLSSFVLLALGTWVPVAGAIIGAAVVTDTFGGPLFIGAAAGLLLSGALFAALYFHFAKLIES